MEIAPSEVLSIWAQIDKIREKKSSSFKIFPHDFFWKSAIFHFDVLIFTFLKVANLGPEKSTYNNESKICLQEFFWTRAICYFEVLMFYFLENPKNIFSILFGGHFGKKWLPGLGFENENTK